MSSWIWCVRLAELPATDDDEKLKPDMSYKGVRKRSIGDDDGHKKP